MRQGKPYRLLRMSDNMVCAENKTCVMDTVGSASNVVERVVNASGTVRKNFDAIDICKLIAALFVVGIHAEPLESFNSLANYAVFECLSRFAVPFFFVSSAFFFFRGGVDGKKLKHYEQRMLILYVIWYIMAFPVTFMRKYSVFFTEYDLSVAIWKSLRGLLFASSFRGSWFLSGSMFCAAVIYFLSKKLTTEQIMKIGGVFYAFCVLTSTYGNLIYRAGFGDIYDNFLFYFAHPYTSIITGLLYFTIGKYFAEHEQEFVRRDTRQYALLSMITLLAMFAEGMIAKRLDLVVSSDCLIMLIPNVWCLMTLVLSAQVRFKHVKEIRASGVIVFFVHFSVLYAFEVLDEYTGLHVDTLTRYVLILLISFSFARFVLKMENKAHWGWMKYLH